MYRTVLLLLILSTLLTIDPFEKQIPLFEHSAFSPQLSDLTVTFNRTHCGPHKSETTANWNNNKKKPNWSVSICLSKSNGRSYQSINWLLRWDLYRRVLRISFGQLPTVWYRGVYLRLRRNAHGRVGSLDTRLSSLCDRCNKRKKRKKNSIKNGEKCQPMLSCLALRLPSHRSTQSIQSYFDVTYNVLYRVCFYVVFVPLLSTDNGT